jgi:hypothetical protein
MSLATVECKSFLKKLQYMDVKSSSRLHDKIVCAVHQTGVSNATVGVLESTDQKKLNQKAQDQNSCAHIANCLTSAGFSA